MPITQLEKLGGSAVKRGIRNKNPGNIDRTGEKWQGMADDQSADPRFIVFKAPEWGIRALAKVLLSYREKHGRRTVRKIIDRWAPPVENNTGAYINAVAADLGVLADDEVDVRQLDVMLPLVKAIISHENGEQPYSDAQLKAGLALAGVHE